MLFDPPRARFEFADQHAMAHDGGMIFDDGAAKADDLLAGGLILGVELGVQQDEIRSDVGAKAVQVCAQIEIVGFQFRLRTGDVGADPPQQLKNEVFGFLGHGCIYSFIVPKNKVQNAPGRAGEATRKSECAGSRFAR